MTLYHEILQFDELFTSIRRHDDFLVIDLKLPLKWEDKKILHQEGDKIQMKVGTQNQTHKIVSFFTLFTEEGTSLLISQIKTIIKWNKDADVFIMGHTHIPEAVIWVDENENIKTYVNLGDWVEHSTYAIIKDSQIRLKTFK